MRIRTALLALATLCGLGVGISSAAATPGAVVHFRLPVSSRDTIARGLGAMWVARTDLFHNVIVWRIDPATNAVTRIAVLQFPGAQIDVGFGSLWITDYFGNAVWRLSPHGTVLARIPTGLQPYDLEMAFGSVWVANHHGHSLTRIDPATDTVIATDTAGDPTQFRDGPQAMTHGAHRLYVGSSNLDVLQSIDPSTDVTTTPSGPTDDAFCGNQLEYLAGYIWSADNCSNTLYQHSPNGAIVWRNVYGPTTGSDVPQVQDETVLDGQLWVAVDQHFDEDTVTPIGGGVVQERNPATGALLRTISVGGDISWVSPGFGSLWVFDALRHNVRRIPTSAA
jgi:streptogramin lyase